MYRHKKTGKLYELVQERILFKDMDMEPTLVDGEYSEQEKYYWRGKETDRPIQEHFVLYKAAYNNPDGPYFVRHKEDWDKEFEKCINTNRHPLERTIKDEKALYYIPRPGVKRYERSNYYETPEIYTVEEYVNGECYTDEGEFEAYLTDGVLFLGTNIANLPWGTLDDFIKEQEAYAFPRENVKIMFIDYPEDK